jgi:enoyl-CoA hydratase/carnithine racemase
VPLSPDTALGGGMQIALAFHCRVAHEAARFELELPSGTWGETPQRRRGNLE